MYQMIDIGQGKNGKGLTSCYKWGLIKVHTILGGSRVNLWVSLGGKPKWLPLHFGYHDVMRTSPIVRAVDPLRTENSCATFFFFASIYFTRMAR